MNELSPEMKKNIRNNWQVGDWVEIFSKSRNQWFRAKIIEIYDDDDGEWLAVVVENTMIKEVQRFNTDVRPIINLNEDDSESEYSDSEVDTSSSNTVSSSFDYTSDSNEDENTRAHRLQKRAAKKRSKHHEMVIIFVERAGSDICNGKYIYITTTEEGYPQFAKVDDTHMKLIQNENDHKWEFMYKQDIYYYSKTDVEFPPSVGWIKTRIADLPNPGVRLDSIKKVETGDMFFVDDPYKFSPFDRITCVFTDIVHQSLGFDLKVLEIHSTFIAISHVIPDSQADKFGLQEGDILLNAGEDDLSRMKTISKVQQTIAETVAVLTNSPLEEQQITMIFAREKSIFKVVLIQRAGAKEVNGKYSIESQENGALRYANNDNPEYKLLRMYVNEDDDEAIWLVRHVPFQSKKFRFHRRKRTKKSRINLNFTHDELMSNGNTNGNVVNYLSASSVDDEEEDDDDHKDFYIVLAAASDQLPPEYGWEAIDPYGLFPGPGLVYYDVNLVPPAAPEITRCQPNPKAVQIHWVCDEMERRPKVCPHMEVWYEVEMRHWLPNTSENGESFETRIWKTNESPFVANKLTNGDAYQFIIRSCNHISSQNSMISSLIIPLQLPPKPKITNITGKSGELYVHFYCANAKDRDIQACFEIIVDPPLDELNQDYPIKEHRLLVESDNKPVRLRNLMNGQEYQIIVASVNSVGVTYSEPETAYPSLEPPQPLLTRVEAGNREITVYFKCDGYDKPDCKAWFEMELYPPPPQLYYERVDGGNGAGKDEEKKDNRQYDKRFSFLNRKKSKVRSRLARKSRWRRATMSQKLMTNVLNVVGSPRAGQLNLPSNGEIKDDDQKSAQPYNEADADDFVAYFRRSIRHYGSPVKIAPVMNGIPYVVRVNAVTLSGSKITEFSKEITPKGPPPMPKIGKLIPMQSAVQIYFECNDYATKEYKAKFEIESHPNPTTLKCTSSPCAFPGLVNGWNYKFQVRSYNKEGRSKWSERSSGVTPLKMPPIPVELRTVPFNHEITVYWVCEELKTPEYSGWYEVESDPPTFTMVVTRQQVRFKRLTNGKNYTFTVSAVNQIGKQTSLPSIPCMPDESIDKKEYVRLKKSIACEVRELVIKKRKDAVRMNAKNKLLNIKQRTQTVRLAEGKQEREKMAKMMDKKRRKKKQANLRAEKKIIERQMRKQRMEDQRERVLKNKRRISFLHRQKVTGLEAHLSRTTRLNPNRASNMIFSNKNKQKIGMFSKNKVRVNVNINMAVGKYGSGGSSIPNINYSSRKKVAFAGTALLPASEIKRIETIVKRSNKSPKKKFMLTNTNSNTSYTSVGSAGSAGSAGSGTSIISTSSAVSVVSVDSVKNGKVKKSKRKSVKKSTQEISMGGKSSSASKKVIPNPSNKNIKRKSRKKGKKKL